MLQSIRDHSQGWLTGVIIFVVCVAFALWGIHSYMGNSAQSDVAAKVNGISIGQSDLNLSYERLRQQEQMQQGADFVVDQKTEMRLKKQALNQLIMGQLLVQAALAADYRVSLDEVYGALLMIPAFQVNGQFSRDRFNEVINRLSYNENTFLNDMRLTMLTNQVRSGFVDSAFVLPNEIDNTIKLIQQKRDLNYLLIPAQHFMSNVKISDAEARNYYMQHQADFTTPEKVSIEYLELSLPQIAAQLHFTDAQLQQFYQNNLNNYTRPQRWHVAHILVKIPDAATPDQIAAAHKKIETIAAQIKNGADFSQMARNTSDDKLSAKDGGVLDWFSPGMIDPVFEKTVSTMQVGQVSDPVKTKYGFSIIKLIEVQKPQIMAFDEVRPQVEKALAQQQAEQIFADDSDKLSNQTYANPSSLDVAAKSLNLQVKSSDFFDRNGGKDHITANHKVVTAAFSPEILQGNNSDVIDIDPDTLLVLRIKQHVAATLQPFAAVRPLVDQKLRQQQAQQQAQALGQQITQELQQGKNGAQIAAQQKLKWVSVPNASRFGSSTPSSLINAAFSMPHPAQGKFTLSSFVLPNGDYAVVMLTAVHEGTFEKSPNTERRVYREELENGYGQLDYSLYVRGLLQKAKIKTNL